MASINSIQTACAIVILGFSGVRNTEAITFSPSSYSEKEYGDFIIPILSGEITKTEEGGIPKKETWVTHPITKKALELSYGMTGFAREHFKERFKDEPLILKYINSSLITCNLNDVKNNIGFEVHRKNIKNFLGDEYYIMDEDDLQEFKILNPTRVDDIVDNKSPKLTAHDFRRTFAIFLIRNKLGNIMTLKHQYKHLNSLMSMWYANHSEISHDLDISLDIELQQIIFESNVAVTTDTLFKIYNSETLSGKEGNRIISERNKHEHHGMIYKTRSEIEKQVKSGKVSIVEHPTGYCLNPNCDRICASDLSTISCQHEVSTPEKAKERNKVRERLIKRFQALNKQNSSMGSILTKILLEIQAIEKTLSVHNIKFEPFNETISARSIFDGNV